MKEKFSVDIGAKISEFLRKMKQVDRSIKETATGADADIGANISNFMRKMNSVKSSLKSLIGKDVDIGAEIAEFKRKAALVKAKALALSRNKIIIPIEARINKFQATIQRIATNMRAFGELARNTLQGSLMAVFPALSPIIAVLAGGIGSLGVMIGTVAGSTFALATAFATAGVAAVGFGAVAIPTIKKLFEENAKLSASQQKAKNAFDSFKATYQDIVKETEKPVLEAFTKGMQAANKIMQMARPMFTSAAEAVSNLMGALKESLGTPPVKAFFDYLNKEAGPMLEIVGKSIGNLFKGLTSMMTAFGPLAKDTANGFLDMTQRFAEWADGLGKSKKFQAFVNYINENMPKIRAIFRDALAGITYFFAAFGPLAADMMSGLQDLMGRFKAWASTLQSNQAFQQFITYIRENAPKVMDLIGNLTKFLVNFGIGLAPLGSKILDLVNGFLSWTNGLMENHRWIGQILAVMISFGGILLAVLPNIIAFSTLFSGLGSVISRIATSVFPLLRTAFSTLWGWIARLGPLITNIAGRVLPMLGSAFTTIGSWLVRLLPIIMNVAARALPLLASAFGILTAPITLTIAIITTLAFIIFKYWDQIYATTARVWTTVTTWIVEKATQIKDGTVQKISELASKVSEFFSNIADAVREKLDQVKQWSSEKWQQAKTDTVNKITEMKNKVQQFFTDIANKVREKLDQAKKFVQEKWTEAKTQTVNKITEMKNQVQQKFTEIANKVREKLEQAKQYVQQKWNEAKTVTVSRLTEMKSQVQSKFTEIANKVREKLEQAKQFIQSKWSEARSITQSKLAAVVSATQQKFEEVKNKVRSKLTEAVSIVGQKIGEMPGKVKSYVGAMTSAGSDLIRGLINGIKNMGAGAINAITGVVDCVVSKAKSMLKIKSPSRVMRDEVGVWITKGIAVGMEAAVGSVLAATQKVVKAAVPDFSTGMQANNKLVSQFNNTLVNLNKKTAIELATIKKNSAAEIAKIESKATLDVAAIKKNAAEKKRKLSASEVRQIERIYENSSKKVTDIQKKSAASIKKIDSSLSKDRFSAVENFISNKKKLEQISSADEVKIWESAVKKFKKGTDEKRLAELQLRDARLAYNKEQFDKEKSYIEQKAKLNKMSMVEELAAWEQVSKRYKKGSAERIEAEQKVAETKQAIHDKLKALSDDYLAKMKEVNQKLLEDEQKLRDEYVKSVDDRTKALIGFAGTFDQVAEQEAIASQTLIDNLKNQVSAMSEWAKNMQLLAAKGVDDGLIAELQAMGPKALEETKALLSMSDEQLSEFQGLWKAKSNIARTQAVAEMEGLRVDTEKKIDELHKNAESQLEALKTDFVNQVKGIRLGATKEFNAMAATLPEIGKHSVQGLMNGMESMRGALIKKAQSIADAVKSTLQSAFDIHSPSRWMRDMIGKNLVNGLIIGINAMESKAIASTAKMAEWFKPDLSGLNITRASLEVGLQMDDLGKQLEKKLDVDLWVHQKEGNAAVGGFTQEVNLYSPRALSPAENARELKKVGKQMALEWGLS